MQRHNFQHDGLTLSYLDSGGDRQPLIALHAHWMEAQTFAPLAEALNPEWRVIALDQRGHGYSDHAQSYTRNDYLTDIAAFLEHLQLERVVLLGNSLGGVNAYQFAARFPERIRALIIEDIGAEIGDDTSFALAWVGTFKTREELAARIGPRIAPYLENSFRRTPNGWQLAFDPHDMVKSQSALNGNHWADWLATSCPAMLIRGAESRVTKPEQIAQMASRRPNTQLRILEGGHVIHASHPQIFAETVRAFLQQL